MTATKDRGTKLKTGAVVLVLAAIALSAPSAQAGTYKVYSCLQPSQPDDTMPALVDDGWGGISTPLPASWKFLDADGWAPVDTDGAAIGGSGSHSGEMMSATSSCSGATPAGSSFLFGSYMSSSATAGNGTWFPAGAPGGSIGGFQFDAPTGTKIASYKIARYATYTPGTVAPSGNLMPGDSGYRVTSLGTDSGNVPGELCGYAQSCQTVGGGSSSNGWQNIMLSGTVSGSGASGLRVGVECTVGPCSFSASLMIHRTEINLRDNVAPEVSNVVGSLASTGPHAGTEHVSFRAKDNESGVYRGIIEVDGVPLVSQVLDTNGGKCQDAGVDPVNPYEFVDRVPCRAGLAVDSPDLSVDTTQLTEGQHLLGIFAEDAAGNRTAVFAPQTVTFDNVPGQDSGLPTGQSALGAGGSCDPCNGKGGDPRSGKIIVNASQSRLKGKYGAKLPVSARLVDADGTPIAQSQIDVLQRIRLPGEDLQKVGVVTTDSQGRYTYNPQTTSSRTIRFAFAAKRGSANYRDTADVDLDVSSTITLRAKNKNVRPFGRMVLRGRVLASPLKKGVAVEIQVRDGKRWRTISVKRTTPDGKLTFTYRFKRVRKAMFQFRALARESSDLPIEEAASKTVRIKVGK